MNARTTRTSLLILTIAAAILLSYTSKDNLFFNGSDSSSFSSPDTDQAFAEAFQNWTSDLQLEGSGTVIRILPDDNEGSRHQRLIVELDSGQSLMIAHNIDLAPRVAGLQEGDRISFYGEYEWNDRGGLMHWTHHDPRGQHPDGWIKHNGKTYQ